MNKTTLYQRTRTGKVQQWSIWVEEKGKSKHPEVWIEHGLVDGKKQLTNDIISKGVNEGKTNETTPLQQATLTMERRVTKQTEKGYRNNTEDLKKELSIDFTQPLPKELCFYKPKNSIDNKKIETLELEGRAVFTVKRDGMMHIIRKSDEFGVEIYSRRMDLVTDKYPHLVADLEKIQYNFILLGEIILDNNGKDNFNGVSQICRSDAEKAIERQEELGKVKYYIFDIAVIGEAGKQETLLHTTTYIDRLNILEGMILIFLEDNSNILRCEILNYNDDFCIPINERRTNRTHESAIKEIKNRGLEGLVVWDSNGTMDPGASYTMNGKAYRPNVLWKSKPKYEDDFIVRFDPENNIGEYGKGKNNGKVKSVHLFQLDEDGQEVFLAKCGGGLSDKQRDFYTTASYPRVWRIEYDSIQPKTGSLRYPVFNIDRTLNKDKTLDECLMSDDIKKARLEVE